MFEPNPTFGLTFLVYLVGMLAIGIAAWRRTRDIGDYILGGRRLGPWVTAMSAGASDMSGWLLLGLPGFAYAAGLESLWLAGGLLVGTWLNWRLVAPRLRIATEEAGDALTLPEFFEHRFDDRSRLLRVVCAIFILTFFLFYTVSGLVAGGKLFDTVFGLPYAWAVTAGTVAIVAYTFLGGFLAVSWTDLVQALLMGFALVLLPAAAVVALGGPGATLEAIAARSPQLLDAWHTVSGEPLGVIGAISLLAWGLGYFGQPHILARFMAIDGVERMPRARRIAMGWVTLTLTGAVCAGLAGIGLVQPPLQGADSEKVFMALAGLLLNPVLAGVCLAAILAAIMSTADSQLLVSSAALTEDLYRPFVRPGASQRELVWVGRVAVLAIAALAFHLALDPHSRVLDLVAYAWAGFGASFGPTLLLALYWPRMTRNGAVAGIIAGGVTVIVWKQLSGGLFDLYEMVPGCLASALAVWVASHLDSRRDLVVSR